MRWQAGHLRMGADIADPPGRSPAADIDIAAEGVNNSLDFYWAANGSGTWHPEQVAESAADSPPSMTPDGSDANIAAAGAKGSLDFYWATSGNATWNPEQVAPPGTVGQRLPRRP